MKKQNGVTLIALVITIIVLLILAGISIAALSGNNGLLTKGNKASLNTQAASIKEIVETSINAVYTRKVSLDPGQPSYDITTPDIVAEMKSQQPADASIISTTDADTVKASGVIEYGEPGKEWTVTLSDDNMSIYTLTDYKGNEYVTSGVSNL